MRDYTQIPGYEHMTQPQARYNYLHDLLDQYRGPREEAVSRMRSCRAWKERGDCRLCSFSGFLGGDPDVCCAWRAEAQPDKAIEILELLLKITPGQGAKVYPAPEPSEQIVKVQSIAEHYGKTHQMAIAQEECAELIQAISKVRRDGETTETLRHLAEELADVRIMCAQLAGLFNVTRAMNDCAVYKLDRQLKRIREEEAGHEKN